MLVKPLFCSCGQVATGFDPGETAADVTDTYGDRKRKAVSGEALEEQPCIKRQRSWAACTSNSSSSAISTYRPKAWYRVSAKNFLGYLDNQLRQSTPIPGLVYYQENLKIQAWQDWRNWPHLRLNIDLGSDQLCGLSAMERLFELNVSGLADFDHGAQRSTLEVLSVCHLKEFWLLMTVSWNLLDGPDQNAYRFHQLQQSNADILQKTTARTNLTFMQLCPLICQELKNAGVELPGEKDSDLEVWDYWKASQKGRSKRERTSTNRFQALLDRAKHALTGSWSIDYFERLHLGLELDMLRGKKFSERLTVKSADVAAGSAVEEGGGREPTKLAQIEDKTLRGVCANAVAISVAMLKDYTHKRVVESVFYALDYIRQWRTNMSKVTKSADESLTFLINMSTTGVGDHLNTGLRVLTGTAVLDRMGFSLKVTDEDRNSVLAMDEDFASLVFSISVAGYKARGVRLLDLQAWPKRMVGSLRGDDEAKEILGEFKVDVEIFREVAAKDDRRKRLAALHKRHLLHLTPNKQYMLACDEVGYGPALADDLRTVVTNNNKVVSCLSPEQGGPREGHREMP
jgi:hypothetical protein